MQNPVQTRAMGCRFRPFFVLHSAFKVIPGEAPASVRRVYGVSPVWIAQTIGIEALAGVTRAAGEAHISFALTQPLLREGGAHTVWLNPANRKIASVVSQDWVDTCEP